MHRFSNILFADLTAAREIRAPLAEFKSIAATEQAHLLLYGVAPEAPQLQKRLRPQGIDRPVVEVLREALTARLSAFGATLGTGEEPTVAVDVGSLPIELVRRVVTDSHDLVVLNADGSNESCAMVRRVMRLCPCPVWVLRPGLSGQRVLAAINPEDELELNYRVLQLARQYVHKTDGELHVMHAWTPYGYPMLTTDSSPEPVSHEAIQGYVDQAESAHKAAFDAIVDDAKIDTDTVRSATRHLIDGSPAQAIARLLGLYHIDLLVMGAVGHSAADRALIGNTAEALFNETSSSVLVVKPDGFVSLVEPAADTPKTTTT